MGLQEIWRRRWPQWPEHMNCMTRQIPRSTIRGIRKGNANADQQEAQAEMAAPFGSCRRLREPGQEITDIEIGQGTDQQAGREAQLAEFECDRGVEEEKGGLGGTHADGKLPIRHADLFMGNAGTAIRPLTAALAVIGGDYTLHGVSRMHERPIGDLVDALNAVGTQIEYTGEQGFPPLRIRRGHIHAQRIAVRGNVSRQFLTALLMVAPLMARDHAVTIDVTWELIKNMTAGSEYPVNNQ